MQEVIPSTVVQSIFEALCSVVVKEPTVVDVSRTDTQVLTGSCAVVCIDRSVAPGNAAQVQPDTADAAVVVVGDTHGQLHDVCAM